jgi:phosphotransferase system IIB component
MSNNNVAIPEIYTQVGTEKLVINGMNEMTPTTEVKLGFSTGTTNNFTLKATELSNIQDTKIILIDKQNPTVEFDLTDGSVYNFSSNATNDLTRLSILFRTIGASTGINTIEKLNAQVYVNAANQITIIAPKKSNYSIYNAVGQLIENGIVTMKSETLNAKLNAGVYVVKINNQTTRVIVK